MSPKGMLSDYYVYAQAWIKDFTPLFYSSCKTSVTVETQENIFSSSSFFYLHTFTTPVTLKLDYGNFLFWEQQIFVTIRSINF